MKQSMGRNMQQKIDAITDLLYDGVLAPEAWQWAFENACQQIGADVYHWFTLDGSGAPVPESASNLDACGLHPRLMQEYEIRHAPNDLRAAAVMRMGLGEVMFDRECISERDLSRNSVYADWLLPLGFKYTTATRVRQEGSAQDIFSFIRATDGQPFGATEKQFLNQLMPHIMRAAKLRARMQQLSRQATLGLAALDTLHQGMLIVDAQCRIQYSNAAAPRLMQESGSMHVVQGAIRCSNASLQARLKTLAENACARPGRAGAFDSARGNKSGHRLVVSVLPLKEGHGLTSIWQRPLALMVLTQPGLVASMNHHLVAEMLGLSPSEARLLLLLLASGKSVKDFAEIEECSWHTARTHLRNLMKKTGCHRQVELVQLLQALHLG